VRGALRSGKQLNAIAGFCAIGDQVTVDRTQELIAELQAEKASLHPEQAG
jgi:hypothetical protein